MKIYIVYPEKRWVYDETIITWFTDAVADGLIDTTHNWKTEDVKEMAAILEDIGHITVGKHPK